MTKTLFVQQKDQEEQESKVVGLVLLLVGMIIVELKTNQH